MSELTISDAPISLRGSVAPMQHALRRGAASYAWSLQHRHLLTTTSSGALLGVAGDALTQLSADGTYDSGRRQPSGGAVLVHFGVAHLHVRATMLGIHEWRH